MAKMRTGKTNKGGTFKKAGEIVYRIKRLEGCSERTIAQYQKVFIDLEKCFGARKHVENITVDDARRWMEWQLHQKIQFSNFRGDRNRKKGVSISSANTYLTFAKSAFNVFLNEGIIQENPFANIKKIKDKQKKVDTLSPLEMKEILEAFDKDWYADFRDFVVVNTMIDTFGRINEICNIKHNDIDFEHGTITFSETKNSRYRTVPVSNKLLRLLQELMEETEEFDSEYLFLSNRGDRLHPDTFRKHFREVVAKTSIKKRVHPHLFRHTSATLFLAEGGSIRALQKILGHRDISTTMIYGHMLDDTIKKQHEMYSPLRLVDTTNKVKTKRKRKR